LELLRWREALLPGLSAAVAASFPELHLWMPWAATPPSDDDLRAALRTGEWAFDEDADWAYVLVEVASGEIVGAAGLHRRVGPRALEIGYWVRSDRAGRGYATAAAGALAEAAAANVPDLDRVEIHMDEANLASAAVPRKLGFRLDRREPRDVQTPGHTGVGLVWVREVGV
jgi:RimJ/RimL family protein N-acetyltransferase